MEQHLKDVTEGAPPSLRQIETGPRDILREAGGMFPAPNDIEAIRDRILEDPDDELRARLRKVGWILD